LVVHSDRGSQYASMQYQALLNRYDIVCSTSRKGKCWTSEYRSDAVAERFFLNLKMEYVWRTCDANQEEARKGASQKTENKAR
jgi:putative transposase